MRLLRYVQPPATSGTGTTTMPPMPFPFRLISLCARVTYGGVVGPGDWRLRHACADPLSLIFAAQVLGQDSAGVESVTFCASGAVVIPTSSPASSLAPIPADFWVMPGESVSLDYTEAQGTDVQLPLVWSIMVP